MTSGTPQLGQATQQELRTGEERLQHLARTTADALWDWDLLTDAMCWNEGMERLFGVSVDSLPPDSRSWTLRLHPDDALWVQQSRQAAIHGTDEFWSAQYRFQRQDGSYAWVDDRGFVLRAADGRGVRMVGGLNDISGQRQAGQQYRCMFSEHPQPMWVCDQASLRLLAVNQAMVRHYGYQEGELLSMDMRLLWPPGQRDQADSAMGMCRDARAAQTLATAATTWRHAHRNGTLMDMEVYVGI
ncbi:MAG TPA: PAS domain-containing protein, partial [Alicycliphilus sp.]|nr:PAS domain-containing protein [Alicycliphilus sp.]